MSFAKMEKRIEEYFDGVSDKQLQEDLEEAGRSIKVCTKCGRELPATIKYFCRHRFGKFGLDSRCKECQGHNFRLPPLKMEAKAGYKICTKCERELLATLEYFHKQDSGTHGLRQPCIECRGARFRPVAKQGYRICSKCGEELSATSEHFRKNAGCKDGLVFICKPCDALQGQVYYEQNKEEIVRKNRNWYQENREEKTLRAREVYAEHSVERREKSRSRYNENREDRRLKANERRKQPKVLERERKYLRERRANDPKYRLRMNISCMMRKALKENKRGLHWETLVDYTLDDYILHLEKWFQPGMSLINYGKGKGKWVVDHVIPVDAFNFKTPKDLDFKRCWALSNLRPLWSEENASKGAKIKIPFQPCLAIGF